MKADGSEQVNLTNNPAGDTNPVWSPDGSQILFISDRGEGCEEGGRCMFIMNADGSKVSRVSQQNDCSTPDWSPAGDKIAFSSEGEIHIYDLTTRNEQKITNNSLTDYNPKFSPDGNQIVWLSGEENNIQAFTMDLDGGNVEQVTDGGNIVDAKWTIDSRLFVLWMNEPDGICFNCVVDPESREVINAGGKGDIQQYLPFWMDDGLRAEMGSGDIRGTGREDIFVLSATFTDLFKFLTSDAGNNRFPDAPAMCGPDHGKNIAEETVQEPSSTGTTGDGSLILGYTGSINPMNQFDVDTACTELSIDCVHGENVTELVLQGVDVIVNFSNKWDVQGSYPALKEASLSGIPIIMLNAEIEEQGFYNLSVEKKIMTGSLAFMLKSMQEGGELAWYNYGDNNYVNPIVEGILQDFPDVKATKIIADYDKNPYNNQQVQNLIAENPGLEAIWTSDNSNDLFWGAVDKANSHIPLIECMPREDMLTAWQIELENGSELSCIAFIRPAGLGYEGIYTAYYLAKGLQLNPERLTGSAMNTLDYPVLEITNGNLPEILGKLDTFILGDYGTLLVPHMDPDQILDEWFLK